MTYVLMPVLTVAAVLMVLRLVLHRRLLVRYAVLWITVTVLLTTLALFPSILDWLAKAVGFAVPANLLFFASIALLLAICLQISTEVSRLERRVQKLAEEIALTRIGRDDTPGAAR